VVWEEGGRGAGGASGAAGGSGVVGISGSGSVMAGMTRGGAAGGGARDEREGFSSTGEAEFDSPQCSHTRTEAYLSGSRFFR
jgi:hypothetical protein